LLNLLLLLLLLLTPLSPKRMVAAEPCAFWEEVTLMLSAPARMLLSNISHKHSDTLNACSSITRQHSQQQQQQQMLNRCTNRHTQTVVVQEGSCCAEQQHF
jgi:hypothetical protein